MGLLDNILGGQGQGHGGGGPSKMTLALMALLAYRTYQGKGRLADMMGRNGPGSGQAPHGGGSMGGGQAGGGGLGDLLGGMFGGGRSHPGSAGGGLGDLLRGGGMGGGGMGGGLGGGMGGGLGGFGGLLGGAAGGGLLGAGLSEVINRMQQSGHRETADSWVGTGQNRPVSPDQLEQALGRDTLEELSSETGKPYDEVLSELSRGLPETVDKLTPDGRLPTDEEHSRW